MDKKYDKNTLISQTPIVCFSSCDVTMKMVSSATSFKLHSQKMSINIFSVCLSLPRWELAICEVHPEVDDEAEGDF